MIEESIGRRAYLNPTLVYELGSQSNLARKRENNVYDVFRNTALMHYYPRNLADSFLSVSLSVTFLRLPRAT